MEQEALKPFAKQADFTKHMRIAHNETPFPCPVLGCDRVGAKGFVLEKALVTHHRNNHADADAYLPKPRDSIVPCPYLGCLEKLQPASLGWHALFCPFRFKR